MTASRSAARARFADLDPRVIALLLDFDGTLVDIAPTPDAVHMPDALRATLATLSGKTGGALAIVSGRPIADLDRQLAPLTLPTAGGHGAEIRMHTGETMRLAQPLPDAMRAALADAAAADPGIVTEDKGYSFTLHFRNAPAQEERLRARIAAVRAAFPDEAVEVQPGKAVFEVKRPGISKGEAVHALMRQVPFAGRTPVFIGDDETDKTVFSILPALGGLGFGVALDIAGLAGVFSTPADVRAALRDLAVK